MLTASRLSTTLRCGRFSLPGTTSGGSTRRSSRRQQWWQDWRIRSGRSKKCWKWPLNNQDGGRHCQRGVSREPQAVKYCPLTSVNKVLESIGWPGAAIPINTLKKPSVMRKCSAGGLSYQPDISGERCTVRRPAGMAILSLSNQRRGVVRITRAIYEGRSTFASTVA